MIRIALDSNILVYLAGISMGPGDDMKIDKVADLIARIVSSTILVAPVQALGELFVVMRRSGAPAAECRELVLEMAGNLDTPASEAVTLFSALDLAVDHKLQHWDAMILSAAADAGCTILLSEDMQHGFVARGVTVINPFATDVHPKLAASLA